MYFYQLYYLLLSIFRGNSLYFYLCDKIILASFNCDIKTIGLSLTFK